MDERSKDVALLRALERRLGRALGRNDRTRLHRLIRQLERLQVPGTAPRDESARKLLYTLAKIALALGLKKLFDRLGDAF